MARRRTLSPEFFSDEDLATLPFEARLLYAGLWCYADREGRLEDRPKYLKAMLFPYDRVDVDKLLTQLANPQLPDRPDKVFLQRYQVCGRQFIVIKEFVKYQNPHPHEPASQYPDPPLHVITENDIPVMHTTNDQGPVKGPMTKDQLKDQVKCHGQKSQEAKLTYGEFQNVRLASDELAKLTERFGEVGANQRIENLSGYIASKGKKYSSHYATILQWEAKDAKGVSNGSRTHQQESTRHSGKPGSAGTTPGKYAHLGTVFDPGGED